MRVVELIEHIPSSTKQEVLDTYRRYGSSVREAVAKSIRFPLSWSNAEDDDSSTCSCSVQVDQVGYPERIADVEVDEKFELAARLQVWLPSLLGFKKRAQEMLQLASDLEPSLSAHVDLHKFSSNVHGADQVVKALVQMANVEHFDLARHVLKVNEDILGAFFFDPHEGEKYYRTNYSTDIRIYWGAIGLFARILGLSVEGLTVKVLAHEYAHAYTHLGFDRVGRRWSGKGFGASEHKLREGLAQYWTVIALKRLESRVPDALSAYETLLPKQPNAYQSHVPWLKSYSPDTVAAALTLLRAKGSLKYDDFCAELERIQPRKG
jgi:hypothetical protein